LNKAQGLINGALTVAQDLLLQSQEPVEIDASVMQDGSDLSELKAKTFQPDNLV
jgi:hypothetical protein